MEGGQILIGNQEYKSRQSAALQKPEHDFSANPHMRLFGQVIFAEISMEGHKHLFCSFRHFDIKCELVRYGCCELQRCVKR